MISKRQLLQTLLGLIQVADFDLLQQEQVLRELAAPSDYKRVRRIAKILKNLVDEFDYTKSPEFTSSVEGKSTSVVEMKKRMSREPRRAAELKERLGQAILDLSNSDAAYALVPADRHSDIETIRQEIEGLRNPE